LQYNAADPADTAKLKEIARLLRENHLASTSRATANSATKQWFIFCNMHHIEASPPQGIPDEDIALYIAYLYAGGRKYKTIKNYISMGIRLFSQEQNIPWTHIKDRPLIWQTLRGVRRELGDASDQKLPITLDMLARIYPKLDMTKQLDITLWAAYLTAFYGLFRKGNITAKKETDFNPRQDIRRRDLILNRTGYISTSDIAKQFSSVKENSKSTSHICQALSSAQSPPWHTCSNMYQQDRMTPSSSRIA
jgi:hypothetical protein